MIGLCPTGTVIPKPTEGDDGELHEDDDDGFDQSQRSRRSQRPKFSKRSKTSAMGSGAADPPGLATVVQAVSPPEGEFHEDDDDGFDQSQRSRRSKHPKSTKRSKSTKCRKSSSKFSKRSKTSATVQEIISGTADPPGLATVVPAGKAASPPDGPPEDESDESGESDESNEYDDEDSEESHSSRRRSRSTSSVTRHRRKRPAKRSNKGGMRMLAEAISTMTKRESTPNSIKFPKLVPFKQKDERNLIDFINDFEQIYQDSSDASKINAFPNFVHGPQYFKRLLIKGSQNNTFTTWAKFKLHVVFASFQDRDGCKSLLASYLQHKKVDVLPGQYSVLTHTFEELLTLRNLLASARPDSVITEGDFVRHFLSCIKTNAVRDFLNLELARASHNPALPRNVFSVSPDNTLAQLERAMDLWGNAQPASSDGALITSRPDISVIGNYHAIREQPVCETITKESTTRKSHMQHYEHQHDDDQRDEEDDDSDSSDSEPKAPRKDKKRASSSGRRKKHKDRVRSKPVDDKSVPVDFSSQIKLIAENVNKQNRQTQRPPQKKAQYQQAIPPPRDSFSASSNEPPQTCSFCRSQFPRQDMRSHRMVCPQLLAGQRRCPNYSRGCTVELVVAPLQTGQRSEVGVSYYDHVKVCSYNKCHFCAKEGKPNDHFSALCSSVTCELCGKKGHRSYLCNYVEQ